MSDKKGIYQDAAKKINQPQKTSPREVLLGIKARLKDILQEVEDAIKKSEGWHDGMALENVHAQIQDIRHRH